MKALVKVRSDFFISTRNVCVRTCRVSIDMELILDIDVPTNFCPFLGYSSTSGGAIGAKRKLDRALYRAIRRQRIFVKKLKRLDHAQH